MKGVMFFTYLSVLAHAALWIGLGVLIRNHFETAISMIVRKPIPENLIGEEKFNAAHNVIRFIGGIMVIIGISKAIAVLASFIASLSHLPTNNFNFKFF